MSRMRPTKHAIERYVERVKPTMDAVQAYEDIDRMIPFGEFVPRPEWMADKDGRDDSNYRYFEISEGIVFLISGGGLIVTVRTRSTLSPEVRATRNKYNRNRRRAKRIKGSNTRDPRSYQP